MSKDNTILILPIKDGFLVKNTQAAECLNYQPNYRPSNCPHDYDGDFYNKDIVMENYANPISEETFWKNPSKYQYQSVFCQSEDGADNVAEKMDCLERDYMGWGAEYGICQEEYIFDFPVNDFYLSGNKTKE